VIPTVLMDYVFRVSPVQKEI